MSCYSKNHLLNVTICTLFTDSYVMLLFSYEHTERIWSFHIQNKFYSRFKHIHSLFYLFLFYSVHFFLGDYALYSCVCTTKNQKKVNNDNFPFVLFFKVMIIMFAYRFGHKQQSHVVWMISRNLRLVYICLWIGM